MFWYRIRENKFERKIKARREGEFDVYSVRKSEVQLYEIILFLFCICLDTY